jgi:hypothetical protein
MFYNIGHVRQLLVCHAEQSKDDLKVQFMQKMEFAKTFLNNFNQNCTVSGQSFGT